MFFASALGFGALTAAGVEAIRIDEAGKIHIMGAVTIGGATTVQSLSTAGAVSAATVSATGAVTGATVKSNGAVTGATVTSAGLLKAGDVSTGGEVAATTVNAAIVNGTNITGGALTAKNATIGGMVIDEGGNVRIPGNLDVIGLNDRLHYTNNVPNETKLIDAADVARLCGDGDGCEIRLAMSNYDPNNPAPASMIAWLFCDATCTYWRTSAQLLDTKTGERKIGTDDNKVINHVLQAWDCYFTDAEYTNRVGTDNLVGFGLLKWIDEYPSSDCSVTIID
ncbi:hypothetical protein [Tateyamaria sp.]|uniref:hypothetical protein n=1 Tax=Tateyamaria sp. TaxID=1929288 RepID=UPI003B220F4B